MSSLPLTILQSCFPDEAKCLQPGRLERSTVIVQKADQVLEQVETFGGEGWICLANDPEIRRIRPRQVPRQAQGSHAGWPIQAEVAREGSSLHVQRVRGGWELTRIDRVDADDGDGFLVSVDLAARDGGDGLRYETFWRNRGIGNLAEIRPESFRFVGFFSQQED